MDEELAESAATGSNSKFLFLSGRLALDLVNTEIVVRGKKGDLLGSPADLENWWEDVRKHYSESFVVENGQLEFDDKLLAEVKLLRGDLRRIFAKLAGKQTLNDTDFAELNRRLALGYQTLTVMPQGKPTGRYRLSGPATGKLLFEIAYSAFNLITGDELERLHQCQNDRCILYFYDTTKSATRHWCSLGCMNRARSRLNYQKKQALLEN
jgi:predicted RNA-binding Zn ribbon-like protein